MTNERNEHGATRARAGHCTVLCLALAGVLIPGACGQATPQAPPSPTAPASATPIAGDAYPGWAAYADEGAGFSFRYPPYWSLRAAPSDGVHASSVTLGWETLRLAIQYRRGAEETAFISDEETRGHEISGTITFLGQELERHVLATDGRVKGVAYRSADGLPWGGGLTFDIGLQSVAADECLDAFALGCDYGEIDILDSLQAEADRVVSSFSLIPTSPPPEDPLAGWSTYLRADYGFSLRHPPAWVLVEGRNFVSLRRATTRLVLGYRESGEAVNVCCRAELGPGTITPAGTVTFLGQDVPRAVLEHEGKVKAVIYNNAERINAGHQVFLISLEDYAVDYAAAAIPQVVQAEADRVIESLATFELPTGMVTPTPIPTRLPPTPTPTPTLLPAAVTVGREGANVRSGPGAVYPWLGYLDPGSTALLTGRHGDWWQIEIDGALAWVSGQSVTVSNASDVPQVEPPPTPTPPAVIPTSAPPSQIEEARWIDVDLDTQTVTAYEGRKVVYSSLASTGLPNTPTVRGQFRIWIKLRVDDMAGPGYYLKDVPHVMYFYRGYAIHAATWHANFGQPMSHGCVNLPTDAAEWLFNWADVGMLVNVHE